MRKYDIIVYGASGFTASFVIEHLLQKDVSIALAGRDEKKIRKNLKDISKAQDLEVFECEPKDAAIFTHLARLIINLAGPYIFSGEEIIKACLKTKTHYMDITGETFFIENVIKNYSKEAEKYGVALINCCGFDSVPADIGVEYLKNALQSNCKIESVMILKKAILNYTTYECLIHGLKNVSTTRKLRSKGAKKENKVKKYFYNENTKSYNVIFMGTDPSVVKRTQNANKSNNKFTAEYFAYFDVGSWFNLQLFKFFFLILLFLSKFNFGVKLLLNYPSFFTFGMIKKERPNKSDLEKASFEIKFFGENQNERKNLTISGPDPGYKTTAICITNCAVSLLQCHSFEGGVFTPAQFFYSKNLHEMLQKDGIVFKLE